MSDDTTPTRSAAVPPPRLKPCPICGKLAVPAHRPFCSPRCRQVDLHHWLSGRYAIPVIDEPDEDDAGA
jgi:endogenous inhibitor of DNA gyrase (YacG/DUF329 family)